MTDRTLSISRPHHRSSRVAEMLLAGACSLAVMLGSGCGVLSDSGLENQKRAHAELQDIGNDYTRLVASVGVENERIAVASKIDQLVRKANAIDVQSAEQKKTAAELAASMSATAGSLRAQTLEILILDQAMLREKIAEGVASAMIVASGAEPRVNANFSATDALISQMRDGANAKQTQLEQEIAAMQGPHDQVNQQHADATQQLNKLNIDVATLRQQANDAGPVDGYPFVEEAAGIKARTIPLKNAIAEAEIQLANLGPDIDRAQGQHDLLQSLHDATNRAEESAKLLRNSVLAAGEEGQKRAASLIEAVDANLAAYQQQEQAEIQPLFDTAIANLQKANRAHKMTAFNAARLAGDLWNLRADTEASNARLYDMLAETAPLTGGDPGQWTTKANEARGQHTSALDEARTSYESALSKSGSSSQNQIARTAVEQLLSSLDGTKIDQSPMDISANSGFKRVPREATQGGAGSGADYSKIMGTMGFDTPQALADFFNNLSNKPPTPGLLKQLMGATYTQDPETIREMRTATAQQNAMALQMIGGMAGPGGKFKVGSVTGSKGELVPETLQNLPPGMTSPHLPIIKHNGKWYVDLDTLKAQMEMMMQRMNDAMENAVPTPSGGRGRGSGGGGFGNN